MSTRDDRRRDNLRDIQPMATLILAYQGLKATAVSVMATSYIVIVCNWVGASNVHRHEVLQSALSNYTNSRRVWTVRACMFRMFDESLCFMLTWWRPVNRTNKQSQYFGDKSLFVPTRKYHNWMRRLKSSLNNWNVNVHEIT